MPSVQYMNQTAPFWDFIAGFEDQFEKPEKEGSSEEHTGAERRQAQEQRPHYGHPCGGRRGGRGFAGRGRHGGPHFGMHPWAQFISTQLGAQSGSDSDNSKDFHPPVDVFNSESSFHVHVSLPGAKKEDVGVNYDADKSELSIAGVIHRPGDEEFLKTLDMGERKVGVFDRKVRLGTERHPAEVDADAITAKLEDGVLRVEIPKVEKDYVEVKKVDIE